MKSLLSTLAPRVVSPHERDNYAMAEDNELEKYVT